jgi:ABC-2 type transport system ATP-binding protein
MTETTVVPLQPRIDDDGAMIRVENLTKKFGNFTAVDSISFDVKKGEVFGLLGPNGAGKSTTLRVLSTLAHPTSGTAKIGGYDIVHQDTEVRKLVGIVSEKMIMYDRLTARENLWFFGSLFEIPADLLNQRIDELLELVQLTKWKNSLVGTFSTGMRQRMNVIRALLNMPQVLFLDEPTLGLDPQSSVEIREFVKKLNRERGTTIIVTTHTMVDADILCDRIAIIDHGKVAALDTSANLKKMISGGDRTVLNLSLSNLTATLLENIKSLDCVQSVSQDNSTSIRLIARGDDALDNVIDGVRRFGGKIASIENLQPTLEDVFLHLTGHEVRDTADQKIPMQRRGGHGGGFEAPRRRIR